MNALIEAKNVRTPRKRLVALASHRDANVRCAVASNPNTPSQVLLRMAVHFPKEVWENPVLDLLFFDNPNLMLEMHPHSRHRLLGSKDAWPEWLYWAARQQDLDILLALCRNPATPLPILESLQQHPDPKVSQAATLHRHYPQSPGLQAALHQVPTEADSAALFEMLLLNMVPLWLWERIAQAPDPALREALARHPQTPPHVLAILMVDEHQEVRQAALEHPNSPTTTREEVLALQEGRALPRKTLLRFLQMGPWLAALVAKNPSSSQSLLRRLSMQEEWRVRQAVAANERLAPSLLRQMAKDPDRDVRLAAASNRSTPSEALQGLLGDPDDEVRQAVLANPTLDKQNLTELDRLQQGDATLSHEQLSHWLRQGSWLRRWVALHPALPADLQQSCAKDGDWQVRQAVAQNPNANPKLLELLAQDPDPDVRQAVTAHLSTPATVLAKLANDEHPEVRLRVLQHPQANASLCRLLAEDPHWMVRQGVAACPHTPPEVLIALAQDPDRDVRQTLAVRQHLPEEAILLLLGGWPTGLDRQTALGPWYVRLCTQDPSILPSVLAHLAQSSEWGRQLAAMHPHTPAPALQELLQDPDWRVRKALASNPALWADLAQSLAQDPDSDVRRMIAANPSLPLEGQLALTQDPHPDVRRELLQRPHLPQAVLQRLMGDGEEELSQQARQHPQASRFLHEIYERVQKLKPVEVGWLEVLASHGSLGRRMAAKHPLTPHHTLQKLAQDPEWMVRLEVARNPHTPPQVLTVLAQDPDRDVRFAVSQHADLPGEAVVILLQDPDDAVRRSLWKNPNLPETLRKSQQQKLLLQAARSPYSLNRAIGLAHPQMPVSELGKIKHQAASDWLVRYALTQNPHTPKAVLHALTQDANHLVAQAALQSLETRHG